MRRPDRVAELIRNYWPHHIQAQVYRGEDGKLRWRIRSSSRGRRIIADSAQGYEQKADAFRGLLLVTGGTYERSGRSVRPDGGVFEQGWITRYRADGVHESIFVQYLSGRDFR